MVTFCYSKINNQNILETIDYFSLWKYFGMTPIQLFPKITEWIFGENNGFQGYSDIAEQMGKWMLPCGQF